MEKKIKITYPIISFNCFEVQVSEEKYEDIQNMCNEERAGYIMGLLDDGEIDWIPDGKKGLISALEADYASIRLVKEINHE